MRIRIRMRPICVFFICVPNSFLCLIHKLKHTHTHTRTYGQIHIHIRIREKYAAGTVPINSPKLIKLSFQVPCNVEQILTLSYGSKSSWSFPLTNNAFKILNADWNHGEIRSEFEMPYMIRYYKNDGSVDVNKSLYTINLHYEKNYKKKLTKLPNNDEEYV